MPRRKNPKQSLTPLELQIMNVLWETGPANVQTVQAQLQGRNLAYTTVQTMLNVLSNLNRAQAEKIRAAPGAGKAAYAGSDNAQSHAAEHP